ncbi:MAG: hypothetical protein HOM96_00615, partial [Rickettsiales bacterium]|nr:hypothetical protein [Rickettsiales bacterium]
MSRSYSSGGADTLGGQGFPSDSNNGSHDKNQEKNIIRFCKFENANSVFFFDKFYKLILKYKFSQEVAQPNTNGARLSAAIEKCLVATDYNIEDIHSKTERARSYDTKGDLKPDITVLHYLIECMTKVSGLDFEKGKYAKAITELSNIYTSYLSFGLHSRCIPYFSPSTNEAITPQQKTLSLQKQKTLSLQKCIQDHKDKAEYKTAKAAKETKAREDDLARMTSSGSAIAGGNSANVSSGLLGSDRQTNLKIRSLLDTYSAYRHLRSDLAEYLKRYTKVSLDTKLKFMQILKESRYIENGGDIKDLLAYNIPRNITFLQKDLEINTLLSNYSRPAAMCLFGYLQNSGVNLDRQLEFLQLLEVLKLYNDKADLQKILNGSRILELINELKELKVEKGQSNSSSVAIKAGGGSASINIPDRDKETISSYLNKYDETEQQLLNAFMQKHVKFDKHAEFITTFHQDLKPNHVFTAEGLQKKLDQVVAQFRKEQQQTHVGPTDSAVAARGGQQHGYSLQGNGVYDKKVKPNQDFIAVGFVAPKIPVTPIDKGHSVGQADDYTHQPNFSMLTNSNGQGGMLAGSSSPVIPRQRQVLGSPNPNGQGGEFVDSPNPLDVSLLTMGSAGNESVLTMSLSVVNNRLEKMEEFIQKSLLETFAISDEGHDEYYAVSKDSYQDYCTRNGIVNSLPAIVDVAKLPKRQLDEYQDSAVSSSSSLRIFSQSDYVIFIMEELGYIQKDSDIDFKTYILTEVSYDEGREKFQLNKDNIQANWTKLVETSGVDQFNGIVA